VLATRRQIGYQIRNKLADLDVRVRSFFHEEELDGDPKHINQCDAQQAFTLLTLLAEPEDRVALRCWCGFGSPSLRSGAWARLRTYCHDQGISPRRALEAMDRGDLVLPQTGELLARFRLLTQRVAELTPLRGPDLLDAIFPQDLEWADPFRALAASFVVDDYDSDYLLDEVRTSVT